MKKANNKSNKLVKVTYEYLGDKFVEKPNGLAEHVLDNGGNRVWLVARGLVSRGG